MKYNKKYNLFGWLSVFTLLLTTACAGVSDLDATQVDNNDQNAVTITVQPQSLASGMRAAAIDPNSHISDGSKVDILFYTIYEVGSDGTTLTPTANPKLVVGNKAQNLFTGELGDGQSVISVTKENYPAKIRLVLASETKYKIAFWAQNSSSTAAFDVKDLQNVKVNYTNAKNNNELRDAFCAVSDVIDGSIRENKVILRRPFAQINVGTTGADYKNIVIGAKVYPNKPVTQSKIKLTGVANQYNVVTGVASGTTTAEFGYDVIPAFMKNDVPTTPNQLYNGTYENEEFLKVDLDKDGKIAAYKINYPTLYTDGTSQTYLTETFKYLSMCYALVTDGVLSEVAISFAETKAENNEAVNGYTPMTITQVPVKKNWRTNILGGLKWMKDPNPGDPEDPNNPNDPNDPGYPGKPDPDDQPNGPGDPDDPDNPDNPDNPDDPDDPYYPEIPQIPNPDYPGPDDPDNPDDPDDPDNPDPDIPPTITPTPPDGPEDPSSVFGFKNLTVNLEPLYIDEYGEDSGYEWEKDEEETE